MWEFCVVTEGIKAHNIQNGYHSPSVLWIGFNAIRHLSLGMAMTYGGKFILEEAVNHSEWMLKTEGGWAFLNTTI